MSWDRNAEGYNAAETGKRSSKHDVTASKSVRKGAQLSIGAKEVQEFQARNSRLNQDFSPALHKALSNRAQTVQYMTDAPKSNLRRYLKKSRMCLKKGHGGFDHGSSTARDKLNRSATGYNK